MKRMIISARNEVRVALMEGKKVYDFSVEAPSNETKGDIHVGVVTRIEPSLEAAFVQYSTQKRHGFLSFSEIVPQYYSDDYKKSGNKTDIVKEGQLLLIQVEKEERGNKGAALTTDISLPGAFSVLKPKNANTGGISRRIEGSERNELRHVLDEIALPDGMGLIVRTAGTGRKKTEIENDVRYSLNIWTAIENAAKNFSGPQLIYKESNLITRALRDYLSSDVQEVIIDTPEAYNTAVEYIKTVRPDFVDNIQLYKGTTPIFTYYQVENQIETAFQRVVSLPSGGSIVIDHTEALTAIDINSSKATSGSNVEETAVSTNTEAARVIAEQLRFRDLGGLVVIDFIDMQDKNNRLRVENALRDALHPDRARIQVGEISSFGLLEMSRQRLRPSLEDTTQIPCPRCSGQGTIRSVHSLAITILRAIDEQASKENTLDVRAQLPVDVATYLLNEKKQELIDIEKLYGVTIYTIPNPAFQSPSYTIERTRKTSAGSVTDPEAPTPNKQSSHQMIAKSKKEVFKFDAKPEIAAVTSASISRTTTTTATKKKSSLGQIVSKLLGIAKSEPTPAPKPMTSGHPNNRRRNQNYSKNRKPQQRRGPGQNPNRQQGPKPPKAPPVK